MIGDGNGPEAYPDGGRGLANRDRRSSGIGEANVEVVLKGGADLTEVAGAGAATGHLSDIGDAAKDQGTVNGDNRDDGEKLDQGGCTAFAFGVKRCFPWG